MVMVSSGNNPSEDLMKFAANLTIDNEEYAQFNEESYKPVKQNPKLKVHATTQDEAVKHNLESAADKNTSMDIIAIFGSKLESGKPGH